MTKLLYLSCHQTLEYDEIKTFHELGFDVFSVGYYTEPANPVNYTRKKLNIPVDPELVKKVKSLPGFNPGHPVQLTKEIVDPFDVIVCSHFVENLELNWPLFADKVVIRRAIAQGNGSYESRFKKYRDAGIYTVRVSKNERTLPNFAGEDCIIYGSVDPDELYGWVGDEISVLTVQKWMKRHPKHTRFDAYDIVTKPFNRKLLGKENHDVPWAESDVTYERLIECLQRARVYFSSCSRPAAFTYTFQEAWIMGCPVVTFGPKLGNFHTNHDGKMYTVHEFIENEVTGFWSDDLNKLQQYILVLLNNHELAKGISAAGRKRAIELFHPNKIKQDWKDFFKYIGVL